MEIFDICAVLVKKMFWIIAEASILFVYPLLLMLDEFLYLMQWFFNAVFSMSRFFAYWNRLRRSSQVLALANESTYDSQRSYLCLFPESSPIANGVVIDSFRSRLR